MVAAAYEPHPGQVRAHRYHYNSYYSIRSRGAGREAENPLEEEQDIVYREEDASTSTPTQAAIRLEIALDAQRNSVTVDPVTLLRYPALTFNGHRIHYDYPYATGVD